MLGWVLSEKLFGSAGPSESTVGLFMSWRTVIGWLVMADLIPNGHEQTSEY